MSDKLCMRNICYLPISTRSHSPAADLTLSQPPSPLPRTPPSPTTDRASPTQPPRKTELRLMPMDTEAVQSAPSLSDTHPNRAKWPKWIAPCVRALEGMIEGQHWDQIVGNWLDLEDILGYPQGQVSHITMGLQTG